MNEALDPLVLRFGLVLVRVTACIVALPVLGQMPNRQVRATVIFVLALVLTASLPSGTTTPAAELLPLLLALIGEVVIGLAMGTCARLIMMAGEVAGQLIGIPMGMGFMQVVDPLSGGQLVVTSRLYVTLTVLVFVAVGGHQAAIYGLAMSFRAWPLGAGIPSGNVGWYVANLAGSIFRSAVALSAPVLVSILAVKVGLGIVARAAPKVQVFFIGFALAIVVGILVLITTAPQTISLLSGLVYSLDDWIPQLLEQARSAP